MASLTQAAPAPGQPAPPRPVPGSGAAIQSVASYRLSATLDPSTRQVQGRGRITYRNPSPDTLGEVWLRLYLNAFRAPDTLWLREASDAFRGSAYDPSAPGWIRLESLTLAETGQSLPLPAGGEAEQTIVRVPLPRPLLPGAALEMDVAWTSQLPRVFARTGWAASEPGTFFMVAQWYPRLAVYDRGAWDTEPWHANAEFFHDVGSYDLELRVPAAYATGASGVRVAEEVDAATRVARYRAEAVTDVAWTAWPGFEPVTRQVTAAGRPVELELLLPPGERAGLERHVAVAAAALDAFSRWYGPYPWPRLTLVVPPPGADGAGGMEYPSLVTTGAAAGLPGPLGAGVRDVEIVTVHEIAHQWFPMQVPTNEGAEAWLDEGFADYLSVRLLSDLYGRDRSAADLPFGRIGYETLLRSVFLSAAARQPLALPSWQYPSFAAYGAAAYGKGSALLLTMERTFGDEPFTAALRAYADRWRWRHPTTADLQASLRESLPDPALVDRLFDDFVRGNRVAEYRVASLSPARAILERRGSPLPVDAQVEYADGTSRLVPWPGDAPTLEVSADGPAIRAVSLDPQARLALQLNRLDDSASLEPDLGAAGALANRWLGMVQALLQALGQIG